MGRVVHGPPSYVRQTSGSKHSQTASVYWPATRYELLIILLGIIVIVLGRDTPERARVSIRSRLTTNVSHRGESASDTDAPLGGQDENLATSTERKAY